jgi:hypothetical protein
MVVPATIVFSIYAILQIGCLVMYTYRLTFYKIGFTLLHFGLLVLLVGCLAGKMAGEEHYIAMRVGTRYQPTLTLESGDLVSLGFYPEISDFQVEKYESGADKFYHADFSVYSTATNRLEETKSLEVNHTIRQNGWKIYLMSYSDGSGELQSLNGVEILNSYSGTNWSELKTAIGSDLSNTEIIYQYYDYGSSSSGGPTVVEESWLESNVNTKCYAHVYVTGEYAIVVVCPEYVTLLLKKDPGEYAVIAGMSLVIAGAILTCLVRFQKKKGEVTVA